MKPIEQRYTAVAIVLHWAIAAAILSNLSVTPCFIRTTRVNRTQATVFVKRLPFNSVKTLFIQERTLGLLGAVRK